MLNVNIVYRESSGDCTSLSSSSNSFVLLESPPEEVKISRLQCTQTNTIIYIFT